MSYLSSIHPSINCISIISKDILYYRLQLYYIISSIYIAAGLFQGGMDLFQVLSRVYPTHPWEKERFLRTTRKGQWYLHKIILKLFPKYSHEIATNFYHPSLVSEENGEGLELDIYIPSLKLAFEYQGKEAINTIRWLLVFHIWYRIMDDEYIYYNLLNYIYGSHPL